MAECGGQDQSQGYHYTFQFWLRERYPLVYLPYHLRQLIAKELDVSSPSGMRGFEMFASQLGIIPRDISLMQTKSRNSDFNYSATLYFFQEYEDQYSIQQVYTVLQEMESTAATIIKDHLPEIIGFYRLQSGQRNGRQNSEPSICQCPRCASSFRSPENRRICHNSLGPLNIRRQRSEDQTDLRNTRSDRMYDSQQPGERRSYQQNQPRDGVCPRMVSELASPIRVPQQDSDCQTVRGSLRDSSEGRQFHAESVETEYSYSMRKCPTFYEPETGGTNISMCSGQPCRCDSTGQQTPLLTPRSDQQINPPTPHHILQNHTSYSDQSYRFPAHDNYTRKKDSVGNPSSPGIPKTQNSVGNPISPSKKSFGYFGCNRVNVIDCDKCRLESDSQQTGVLRIYSDPANTCRLHSDENSHRTISGLRNESECSDRNTSSLNRTDQREFEMNYQELPSNGPTEPKIFGSQHYERACDYGQTEPKVFGSQHYERACDYDQTELKVCRPKSYEKNCDRKVETKQRKSSDAEHYRKLSDGSSSIQQSIGRQCTCGSSKANSVPCAERVRTQSAANFCNPNENGIESFDKDSRQSMWSRCTCGASLANHISCMGNERSEEAKYISEGYLSFGENCQETPESEQAEIVYARTDTEGRYSWHGEKGESRQTISSRNSDSDPGPLSSMSSTSSRSSLDSDRPVVILTWSPGSDPVLDKRKKNHVEEIMFLGKKLKKKKIRVKTDRDNFRGRERREFLESSLPNAKYVIACLSPEYAQDIKVSNGASPQESQLNTRYIYEYMKDEYYRNQCQNKRVIPVLFPNSGACYDKHVSICMRSTYVYTFPDHIDKIIQLIMAT